MSEPDLPATDLPEQLRVRREKRQRLLDADEGRTPYPVAVPRTHSLAQVRAAHPDLEPGAETDDVVSVAGRVVFVRYDGGGAAGGSISRVDLTSGNPWLSRRWRAGAETAITFQP